MSDLKIGNFEVDVKFLITIFVLVVVTYLILSGRLDPIDIWDNVVTWVGKLIEKFHK